jgi:hypothetical protein
VEGGAVRYARSAAFAGEPERALEVGRQFFINNGFQVSRLAEMSFGARGGGMVSSNQHAILGVSQIKVTAEQGALSFNANLGGVRRLVWFLILFLLIMFLWPLVMAWAMGSEGIGRLLLMDVALLIPVPLLVVWMRRRTERALDTLLHNMVTVGAERGPMPAV